MSSTMQNKKFLNRALEQRSFLDFEFPRKETHPQIARLPFFENIIIQESKAALLAEHNPLGRSTPLYSYIGARARKFKLKFQLTLPLLIEQAITYSKYVDVINSDGKYSKRKGFFTNVVGGDISDMGMAAHAVKEYQAGLREELEDSYVQGLLRNNPQLNGEEIRSIKADHPMTADEMMADHARRNSKVGRLGSFLDTQFTRFGNFIDRAIHDATGNEPPGVKKNPRLLEQQEIITIVLWWINVVRASVVNNSEEPIYGPPIVRLSHGILYDKIPCVCSDYSLDWDTNAGFDLKTLLPRSISISMNLLELRAGDFQTFKPGDAIKRDNMVGYEVLFKPAGKKSMDPGPIEALGSWQGEQDSAVIHDALDFGQNDHLGADGAFSYGP